MSQWGKVLMLAWMLLLNQAAQGEVYRCKEKNGGVVYTDKRCQTSDTTSTDVSTQRSRSTMQAETSDENNAWVEATRAENGSYYVDGIVSGTKTMFQISTGSTMTALPREMSQNVENCLPRTFETVSGAVSGCVGRVEKIEIGSITFQRVDVALLPNLKIPLLGMNLISQLKMEQVRDKMRLASNHARGR